MPIYNISATRLTLSYTGTAAKYTPVMGSYDPTSAVEADAQIKVFASYTVANMFVRVATNSRNGTDLLTLRNNGASTAVTVTATGPVTGILEDVVNTAALVSGDLIDTLIDNGTSTSGSLDIPIISYTMQSTSNITLLAATNVTGTNVSAAFTRYMAISGELGLTGTESRAHYTARTATTLANLRTYVRTNATTTASTLDVRVNSASSALTISISAAATGEQQDIINTVSIAVGDEINYRIVAGATGAINLSGVQSETRAAARPLISPDVGGSTIGGAGGTVYTFLDGNLDQADSSNELNTQMKWRSSDSFTNLFVNVMTNTRTTACTVTVRKNTADTAVTLSITALTAGLYEDLTNTVAFASGDLGDYELTAAAGSGTCTISVVAVQQSTAILGLGVTVDWSGNNDFTDILDALSGYVLSAKWRRGRDTES